VIVRILTASGDYLMVDPSTVETDVGAALSAPRYFSIPGARWINKQGTFFLDTADAVEHYDDLDEFLREGWSYGGSE
jgi:hypothetical protein